MNSFKLDISTKIYFGTGEFSRVKTAVKGLGKKAMIVIGQGSVKKHGYLDKLINYLNDEGINSEVFEGIEPNPRSKTINKAGKQANKSKVDFLIALGGGSVMDASKGIAIVAKSGNDVWDYCSVRGKKTKRPDSALPIVAIPTLAATGSEINGGSVITNPDTKQKAVIHNNKVVPVAAIIDPELTLTVPNNYLVDGAVDIICHSIETYISTKIDNTIPDFMTMSLVRTVKNAVDTIKEDSKNLRAREDLCWASSLAMIGLFSGRSGGWPIHEIEHAISGIYDVSHGLGLTWLLPAMLRYNTPHNGDRLLRLLSFMMHENTNHYDDMIDAISDLTKWLEDVGALRSLVNSGIEDLDIDAVSQATIDVYGNADGYIHGIEPMGFKNIKELLVDAFN
jgi:alcohol dehydrogenase YqhD (iron-dependent ADH family)